MGRKGDKLILPLSSQRAQRKDLEVNRYPASPEAGSNYFTTGLTEGAEKKGFIFSRRYRRLTQMTPPPMSVSLQTFFLFFFSPDLREVIFFYRNGRKRFAMGRKGDKLILPLSSQRAQRKDLEVNRYPASPEAGSNYFTTELSENTEKKGFIFIRRYRRLTQMTPPPMSVSLQTFFLFFFSPDLREVIFFTAMDAKGSQRGVN
ncbi:hypothetical protein M3O96_14210 [Aquiflexum sp. TKW24L]|uniref:hypothetical protein n=1 Tax=Aquiflexum sp. TKW24L TaxID=2942212 RepID=UPI0020BEF641|nr:hypothetical protein [Aquiflexum sp. TKW24L]MCL6260251.1 hypothetical protein [Aquiflexum sp. TKW24L]